jgi:hypothetical protein
MLARIAVLATPSVPQRSCEWNAASQTGQSEATHAWRGECSIRDVGVNWVKRETCMALLVQVDDLTATFDREADETVRERVFASLTGINLLHREGLTRLVREVREAGAGVGIERALEQDEVVKTLLGLYDLAELDVPEHPSQLGFVPLEKLLGK